MKSGAVRELVLKGGRGSAKSSFASINGIMLLLRNPSIHGVVMRKVANTLRTSVLEQYKWAIGQLGLTDKFKWTASPMEISYLRTGQKILFFGADDPGKLKSIKMASGYIGFLHFEELDQFYGPEEIRNIEQSVLRGGELAYVMKVFNPPKTRDHWVNGYCLEEKDGQMIHHSSYETTPVKWIGESFIRNALHLKKTNPNAYEHEYMGIANGTGGQIFDNVERRVIKPEEWQGLYTYCGHDFGFAVDPDAFIRCAYDSRRKVLYIVDEYRGVGNGLDTLARELKRRSKGDVITADSAEPRSISELRARSVRVFGAKKGPDSVNHGVRWLQTRSKIIIDSKACPHAAKEFFLYEYQLDREGHFISRFPDKNNHFIDAVRYAMESVSTQKVARASK